MAIKKVIPKKIKKAIKAAPKKAIKPAIKKPIKTGEKRKDGSREYAYMLYMQKVPQNDIAERCNVSIQTVSSWKKNDNWELKRASKNISMDELIVKALGKINLMLDADDFNADGFAKAVSQLKSLKNRTTVDDEVMVFMDFQNHIIERRNIEGIPSETIKTIVLLQDNYIQFKIGNSGK